MSIENRIKKLEGFVEPEHQGGTSIFLETMDPEEIETKIQEAGEEGYRSVVILPRKLSPEEWSKGVREKVTGKEIVDPGAA